MLRRSWRLVLGAVLVLGLGQSESFAGVVPISQERGIGARADTGFDGPPGYDKTFSGLGLFDDETSAFVETAQDGDTANSRVTQRSNVSDSRITASGTYEYKNRGEFADGVSTVRVVFDVIESQRYALSYDLEGLNVSRPARAPAARVELLRLDPSGDPIHRGFLRIHPEDEEFDPDVQFNASGVLEAGRYEFLFETGGLDYTAFPVDDSSRATVNYDVSLAFSDNNGGGPNPIPLPPGVWAGGAMLGAIAFGRVRQMLARNR
jgi:hypothetical protein